jgi:spermidine synthase
VLGTLGWIAPLFFLSGLAGLMYEVVWMRMLTLVFGGETLAVSSVLTAFMGGLALGGFAAGRMVDRRREPLRLYAWLEAAIGLYGVAVPRLVNGLQTLYVALFGLLGAPDGWLDASRFILACAVLIVPTTLMGATVPVVIRAVVHHAHEAGRRSGLLYALNTFGAVAGVVLAGFWLLPRLGFTTTSYLAVGVNVGVGVVAWALSQAPRLPAAAVPAAAPTGRPTAMPRAQPPRHRLLPMLAFGLSGATALAYEVVWTRLFVLNFGTSVYAFTITLATVLLGLAVGSLVGARWADQWARRSRPALIFGVLQSGIAVAGMLLTPLLGDLPNRFLGLYAWAGGGWPRLILGEFLLSGALLLPQTLLFGATFPLAVAWFRAAPAIGQRVGALYAANTLGAILGAVLGGFVLIPVLGLQGALMALAWSNGALGLVCCGLAEHRGAARAKWPAGAVVGLLAVGAFVTPSWDPKVLYSGAYLYAPEYLDAFAGDSLAEKLQHHRLLFKKDGAAASVAVFEGRYRFLRINGKTDAGNSPDMQTQQLLAHLPLLLHPQPQDVLVIGLGSGVTLGTALHHPIARADAVEISPEVVEASRFFDDVNQRALADPRARLYIVDGRTWVRGSGQRYDVIISEPSNPWQSGNANLFTREHYEFVRAALRPGGVFCQWLPYYRMTEADFKTGVRTFRAVFPHTTLWVSTTDALLIGTLAPLAIDPAVWERRLRHDPLRRSLAQAGFETLASLLDLFMLDEADVARFVDGPDPHLHTDDRPILEFSAPKSLYVTGAQENLRALQLARRRGVEALLAPGPGRAQTLLALAREAYRRGEVERAIAMSQAIIAQDGELTEPHLWLGRLYGQQARYEDAIAHLRRAVELDPHRAEAANDLGLAYVQTGRPAEARAAFAQAIAARANYAEAHYNLGVLLFSAYQDPAGARAAFERVLTLVPEHVEAHNALGALLVVLGEYGAARHHFEQALRLDPSHPRARRNLEKLDRMGPTHGR